MRVRTAFGDETLGKAMVNVAYGRVLVFPLSEVPGIRGPRLSPSSVMYEEQHLIVSDWVLEIQEC